MAFFARLLMGAILVAVDGVSGHAANHTTHHRADHAMRGQATDSGAADAAQNGAGVVIMS